MYIKTNAFVISSIKYAEADLIVKCYTESHGMLSFLVKGVRKSKRGKIKVSYFQALSYLEIEFSFRPNKNLLFFKEIGVKHTFNLIQRDVFKSTLSMFLAEILQSCIQEEEANTKVFSFIETTLFELEKADKIGHFHLLFLIQLSEHLGFYPNKELDAFGYFNLIDGVFQLKETNRYCFIGSEVEDLKMLLNFNYHNAQQLKLNKQSRLQLLDLLLLYYEIQVQNFKKPLSYSVLQEVFASI